LATSSRQLSTILRNGWQRYRRLPANVIALSLVSLFNDVSSEIIYPLLPLFLSLTLGASPFVIGAIEGGAESISSLLKLASGYFSDFFAKRKFPIFVGYALSSATRPLLGFATMWTQVLGIRLIDRVGKGIRTAPRDAMIADSTPPEKRGLAFGFHRAMDHTGAVVGPLIGFFLIYFLAADRQNPSAAEFGQIFLAASIPALLVMITIAFFVKEKPELKNENLKSAGGAALETRVLRGNFLRYLLILFLFTLSNSSDAFLLLRAEQCGVSPVTIPLLWAFLHAVKVFSSLVGGDLSDRIGRKTLIFTGWILYALVYCGFAFAVSATQIWALFLLYGIYFGLTEGVEKALVADLVPAERRGTAYGFYHLAFGIAVFPASLMLGAIWNFYGFQAAFLTSAAISSLAAVLILTLKTRQTV
jgi:MFS family permease